MQLSDKLLLAILNGIPNHQEKLKIEDFNNSLLSLGIPEESVKYKFLFENKLIESNVSSFISLSKANNLKIKLADGQKYIYLTEQGQALLLSLQTDHIREKFQEL